VLQLHLRPLWDTGPHGRHYRCWTS
jgi:hypothetical protein